MSLFESHESNALHSHKQWPHEMDTIKCTHINDLMNIMNGSLNSWINQIHAWATKHMHELINGLANPHFDQSTTQPSEIIH